MTILGGVVVPGITSQGYLNSADLTTVNVVGSSATALTAEKTAGAGYALQVDTSAANAATGVKVTSAAAASGVAISVISSGANEALTINAKGSGAVTVGGVSTGDVTIGHASNNYANFARTKVADGTGDPAALGSVGGAGRPTTAGQDGWLAVKVAGTAKWIPVWA